MAGTKPRAKPKPRAKQWPQPKTGPKVPKNWQNKFLANLRRVPIVTHAANRAGVTKKTAYLERQRSPEFAELWEDALDEGKERLEAEAHKRAHSYSDTLLIFLLKAHDPAKYNDRMRVEVSGPNGGAIKVSTPAERAKALAELIQKSKPPADDTPTE